MPDRVAIISDIHGNVPALDAVMRDIRARGVDEVIVAGDLIGRGPEGNLVVERIADSGYRAIRGNHEEYVLNFVRRRVPDDWWVTDEWAAARFMAAELAAVNADWVEELPESLGIDRAPGLRVVHGSPDSAVEGLGPWTSEATLERHLRGVGERTLVCGHTHRPMIRELSSGSIVNIGSVGLPFNEDPRAQYAIFSFKQGVWHPELVGVDYDRAETLRRYASTGFWTEGGVTAQLLAFEVVFARPYLVPFLVWARGAECAPHACNIDRFLEEIGHSGSLKDFANEYGFRL